MLFYRNTFFSTHQLVVDWVSGAGTEGETLQDRAGGRCSSGSKSQLDDQYHEYHYVIGISGTDIICISCQLLCL